MGRARRLGEKESELTIDTQCVEQMTEAPPEQHDQAAPRLLLGRQAA